MKRYMPKKKGGGGKKIIGRYFKLEGETGDEGQGSWNRCPNKEMSCNLEEKPKRSGKNTEYRHQTGKQERKRGTLTQVRADISPYLKKWGN